jgi:hypothetical protein
MLNPFLSVSPQEGEHLESIFKEIKLHMILVGVMGTLTKTIQANLWQTSIR